MKPPFDTAAVSVRVALPIDAEVLAKLNAEFNDVASVPQRFLFALSQPAPTELFLLANVGEVSIGFLCFHEVLSACYASPAIEVTEIYVQPAARGRGVGLAMLQEVLRHAHTLKASEVVLRTNQSNHKMQSLLVRAGYEQAEQVVYRWRHP